MHLCNYGISKQALSEGTGRIKIVMKSGIYVYSDRLFIAAWIFQVKMRATAAAIRKLHVKIKVTLPIMPRLLMNTAGVKEEEHSDSGFSKIRHTGLETGNKPSHLL